MNSINAHPVLGQAIVFSKNPDPSKPPPPPDTGYRAVHQIRLQAISHNYTCVESAATRQRCSVIVVVKADGYGHGAIESAIHLADNVGADAFAVATLEEGIALRKALDSTPPGTNPNHIGGHPSMSMQGSSSGATVATMAAGAVTSSLFAPPAVSSSAANSVMTKPASSVAPTTATTATGLSTNSFDTKSQTSASSQNSPLTYYPSGSTMNGGANFPTRKLRAPHVRILVLGPPVGYPRCFDDYYHFNIEIMCTGPEVARALMEWCLDETERKRTQVERAANDAKAAALFAARPAVRDAAVAQPPKAPSSSGVPNLNEATKEMQVVEPGMNGQGKVSDNNKSTYPGQNTDQLCDTKGPQLPPTQMPQQHYREPTLNATLGNVSGQDLAKEVRAFLISQQAAKELKQQQSNLSNDGGGGGASVVAGTTAGGATTVMQSNTQNTPGHTPTQSVVMMNGASQQPAGKGQVFGGIEAIAKSSRTREKAAARANGIFHEDSGDDLPAFAANSKSGTSTPSAEPSTSAMKNATFPTATSVAAAVASTANTNSLQAARKRRLRYHILVDSGMGRLGFKTLPVEVSDVGVRRDTVEIIHELVEMEVAGAPVEFFGMCTHMADAVSTSTYTQDQMNRFKGLLKRVRGAGISIPTVSTDNSAALLTTTLTHFDAKVLLSQPQADTRGFVRTGGGIYGQRPAFKQLRAVSTLLASVRHVAVLKEGESVGYDRAYIAPMNVRIATLTMGFADGYPRDLGNGVGKVAIRGHLFPVAGNVCMDMLMVELGPAGDKTGPGSEVVVGDTAVLWGPLDENDGDGLVPLAEIAAKLKTTQSALTCGLNKIRVSRQYV